MKKDSLSGREIVQLIHDLELRVETKLDAMAQSMTEKIDSKVSFATFTWVLGVLMVVVVGAQAVTYKKVETVADKTSETQNSVSRIEGQLTK